VSHKSTIIAANLKTTSDAEMDTAMLPTVNNDRKFLNADEMALLNEIQSRANQANMVCIIYVVRT
jgi:hypothetical protein